MRKRTMVISAVAVLAVGGGVAYAAWSSSGSGTGSAASTTSVNSSITATDAAAGLFPGRTVAYTVTINNPNAYPVKVTSISAGSSNEVNGCAAGTVTSPAVTNPGDVVAANGSAVYTLQATMNADASDACKSQNFVLPLSATLVSAAS